MLNVSCPTKPDAACCTVRAACCTVRVACCTVRVVCCTVRVACSGQHAAMQQKHGTSCPHACMHAWCMLQGSCGCMLHFACCMLHSTRSVCTLRVSCSTHVACCRCMLHDARCMCRVACWMHVVACCRCMLHVVVVAFFMLPSHVARGKLRVIVFVLPSARSLLRAAVWLVRYALVLPRRNIRCAYRRGA
jgi:hypothetical protein